MDKNREVLDIAVGLLRLLGRRLGLDGRILPLHVLTNRDSRRLIFVEQMLDVIPKYTPSNEVRKKI